MIGAEHDDSNVTTGDPLLIGEVLVTRNQHVEALGLGYGQQFPVFKRTPVHFGSRDDFMIGENGPRADRHVRIKQDAGHADQSISSMATSGERDWLYSTANEQGGKRNFIRHAERYYATLTLPATALTFLGDARQIATADNTLTAAPIQNASV